MRWYEHKKAFVTWLSLNLSFCSSGQQSSYVGHLTLMGIENPKIFKETFLRVLARSQFFLFALGVQTAEVGFIPSISDYRLSFQGCVNRSICLWLYTAKFLKTNQKVKQSCHIAHNKRSNKITKMYKLQAMNQILTFVRWLYTQCNTVLHDFNGH